MEDLQGSSSESEPTPLNCRSSCTCSHNADSSPQECAHEMELRIAKCKED